MSGRDLLSISFEYIKKIFKMQALLFGENKIKLL